MAIEDRKDFAFSDVENFKAVDNPGGRIAAATFNGVAKPGSAYPGTFSFHVSATAMGSFRVELRTAGGASLLADSVSNPIDIGRPSPAVIQILPPTEDLRAIPR